MNIRRFFYLIIILIVFLFPSNEIYGQSENQTFPVYIVQPGDTINVISLKFNVSAADIIAANNIADPNILSVNTRLLIPGIKGVSGVLTYNAVSIGENPDSLSREFQIPKEVIYRLNRTTSPSEFYVGSNVILVETPSISLEKSTLATGETLLAKSIKNNLSLWETIILNQVDSPWNVLPNEKIVLSSEDAIETQEDIEFFHLPLTQGQTAVISVKSSSQQLRGNIGEMKLHFFENDTVHSAIFGIHAMLPPGLYPLHLEYQNNVQENVVIDQLILIQKGFYPQDPPLQVDPSTLDETLTKPEDELIFNVALPFNSEKYWIDKFNYPVDQPICIKSWFGNRRSYNNQPYNKFHTGVDFGVCANLNIYAPADGKVVFTDSLLTRGNSTLIDHGLGVYSGFWHQETILVEEGQFVKAGELIGIIGNTGRSTGPHLHWELIVNGVQVDPLPWVETIFP